MQIGCPQCNTHYALDDRLVPPGGAPVQCTRCGHVFIAYPPGEGQTPAVTPPAPAVPPPPAADRTHVFGGAPPPSGRAPGAAPTPAFGTNTPPPPTANNATQVFGAHPPAAPAPGADARPFVAGATQVFGKAGAGVPPAPSSPVAHTQVFGAAGAGAPPAPASPVAHTQVFGAAGVVAPPAPSSPVAHTQVFGKAGAAAPLAPSSPVAHTQVFGKAGAAAPPVASNPVAHTQVFGAAGAAAPPAPSSSPAHTQVFGAVGAAAPPGPSSPAARTQVFGGSASAAPTGPSSVASRNQVFGAGGASASPPRPSVPAGLAQTQVFGAGEPLAGAPPAGSAMAPGTGAGRPVARPGGVMLPPEDPGFVAPALPGFGPQRHDSRGTSRPDAAEIALRRQFQRRNRLAVGILVAGALSVGAVAVVRVVVPAFRNVPAAAVVEEEAAFSQLRKDDAASRAQALARLQALVAQQPRYVEARAALALGLLLELDDRRAAIQRYTREAEALATQRARLEAERPGPDWRVLANRLVDRIAVLKTKSDPLIVDAKEIQTQANASFAALMKMEASQPAERLARTRTEALFNAIDGRDQAIALAERYRLLGSQDGWAEVASAEYALNTRVPPETSAQALAGVRALQQRDTTFLRAYVLGSRLALLLKQPALATAQLEAVLALNPRHALAQALAEDARAAEQHEH